MTIKNLDVFLSSDVDSNHSSTAIIRDVLIPEIFSEDSEEILYWAGKKLQRKFSSNEMDDVVTLFHNVGFGDLTLDKSKKTKYIFTLSGDNVVERINNNDNQEVEFSIETGFLTEFVENTTDRYCTGEFEYNARKGIVQITVNVDKKNKIPTEDKDTEQPNTRTDNKKADA